MQNPAKKLYLLSLGCPKNLVDSEVMLGYLEGQGYLVCDAPERADLLVVNTCGFIQSAVEEAIDEILSLSLYKEEDPRKLLVVTGCLVQRYGQTLKDELPEVDLFIGTEGFHDIAARIGRLIEGKRDPELILAPPVYLMESSTPRRISTPVHRAYLKITEGCINRCSYCLIPALRGRLRSRTIADLLTEANRLAAAGVQELTLVAQDLTAYGLDLAENGKPNLLDLLKNLLTHADIPWIRLLYMHPARVNMALLQLMADNPRILPYFDIPLQHVSNRILNAMKRPYTKRQALDLIANIRNLLPRQAIRTSFMVGFPGEKEKDVEELAEFMTNIRLDHVGIFTYSNEEGCAAAQLPEQCDEKIKEERRNLLMEIQAEISLRKNSALVGKREIVLVEGLSAETDLLLEGRTIFQAPDVDGRIYINEGQCAAGDFVWVEFTEAHTYDLVGRIVAGAEQD